METACVRRVGTSPVALVARTPVLVLHTTGRRSGRPRATVLAVQEEPDGSMLVVGGAGDQLAVPDWVTNVRADADLEVTIHRRRVAVRALELAGDERTKAWSELRRVWPRIDGYERKAGRSVPVFRFTAR